MEFGKLEDISQVNWNLPDEDAANRLRLGKAKNHKLYFGSPAWGVKHWSGKIYPKTSEPSEYLHFYSKNFNSIELNTTHYRIPTLENAKEWKSVVPQGFQFCPKVHKDISHDRVGLLDKNLLKRWIFFLESLSTHLGPCFIQFHENFSYEDKMLLFRFLESWPKDFRLTLELRHPSWYQKGTVLPALSEYLHRKNIGLVITDVAGKRDILHSSVTAPWTMIRLIGNDLDPSDQLRLNFWKDRIHDWAELGLEETYLFLHQPDDIFTIEFSMLASQLFQEKGFDEVPQFNLQTEKDLFSFISE